MAEQVTELLTSLNNFIDFGIKGNALQKWKFLSLLIAICYFPISILIKWNSKKLRNSIIWNIFYSFYFVLFAFVNLSLFLSSVKPQINLRDALLSSMSASQEYRVPVTLLIACTIGFGYFDGVAHYIRYGKAPSNHTLYRLVTFPLWVHAIFVNEEIITRIAMLELLVNSIVFIYRAAAPYIDRSALKLNIIPAILFVRAVQLAIYTYLFVDQFYSFDNTVSNALFWNAQIGIMLHVLALSFMAVSITKEYLPAFRPGMAVFILLFHVFAIVGALHCWYLPNGLQLLIEAFVLYTISGFGITCGAHRLWAHRSYKAHWSFRLCLMILNSFANQGVVIHWARDHRLHHKYSEKEEDPHNASRGFFYSHMGWLLLKKSDKVRNAGREIDISDLLEDEILLFQKRWDPYWNQFICFILPALAGLYFHGSFWVGFFVLGCLRWIISLHATWTVNSVAHLWGERPYNPNINPAESMFTSLVAVGEGWHNWHHEYPFDYATSEGGIFSQWNPSKLLIDSAAKLNLVWGRKRATLIWEKAKLSRLADEKKIAEQVAAELKKNPSISKLANFKGALAANVVEKSLPRSIFYLLEDILLCGMVAAVAALIRWSKVELFPSEWTLTNNFASTLSWVAYAAIQGSAAVRLWVIGYESAGGRFSDYRCLNLITGSLLHAAMLIPFRSRIANKENERSKASLTRCLSDDAFSIFKFDMQTALSYGGVMVAAFIVSYSCLMYYFGARLFFLYFVGPLFVLHLWLVLYEWLMDNGPQSCFDLNLNENVMQLFTADWLLSTWQNATNGRQHVWTRVIDRLHHHLCLSHIVQAVDFNVPHYHVKEAFGQLGELVREVTLDVMD